MENWVLLTKTACHRRDRRTNGPSQIATPWAPDGAKNILFKIKNYSSFKCCQDEFAQFVKASKHPPNELRESFIFMFQWIQFIMFHYSVPPTLNKYQHYLFKGNMNGCIYPCSVPRCYPPEVYHQDGLQPRTSPGPGFRTSKTPSLGSRKSSLSNHSSRPSSCSSRSCSPRPRLRRESAQVLIILVKW